METTVPFNEKGKPRVQRGVVPERSEVVRKYNEKFLSPSEARRRKKFRIHLSCVCVYPFLQGGDLSFVMFL